MPKRQDLPITQQMINKAWDLYGPKYRIIEHFKEGGRVYLTIKDPTAEEHTVRRSDFMSASDRGDPYMTGLTAQ